jgi:hypothetical protein
MYHNADRSESLQPSSIVDTFYPFQDPSEPNAHPEDRDFMLLRNVGTDVLSYAI